MSGFSLAGGAHLYIGPPAAFLFLKTKEWDSRKSEQIS